MARQASKSFDQVDFAERFHSRAVVAIMYRVSHRGKTHLIIYLDDSHSLLNLTNGLLRNSMRPSYVLLLLMLLFFRTGVGARDEQPPKKIACSE